MKNYISTPSVSTGWQNALYVFETVPELYLIISTDLHILTASNAYLKEASLNRREIAGLTISFLFKNIEHTEGQDTARKLSASLLQVIETGQEQRLNYLQYDLFNRKPWKPEAEIRSWSVINSPVLNEEGQILYIIHKVLDVSEELKKDRALELLHAQEEGWKQEQQFKSVVENIPDVVTRWDKDLKLIYANSAFALKTGLSYPALLGKTAMEMTPEEVAIPFMDKMREVFENGEPREHFTPISAPDSNLYFYSRLVPEKAADGTVKSVLRIARDITDLKEAQEKLKESRDLLQSVFNESPNSISVLKILYSPRAEVVDFEIVLASDSTYKLLGNRDLIGQRFSHQFPSAMQNGIFDQFKEVARSGKPADFELRYEGEGLKYWFRFIANKLDHMLVLTTEDITNRKEAEMRLIESKNLLQSVIDASLSTISVRKAIRNEQGKIIDFEWILLNKKAESYWKQREVIGKRLSEITPGSYINGVFDKFVSTVEEGQVQRFEQHYFIDGKHNWVLINAVRLNDGLVVSSQDITESKLAEQQLKKNNDLLSSIFNSSILGVSVYQAVRDDKHRIIDFQFLLCSGLTQKLLGRNDLAGKSLLETYPAVQAKGLFEKMVEVVEQDIMLDIQDDLSHIGLDHMWICQRAVKLNDGLITTWIDITGQKNAEEELIKQNALLKQAEEVASIGSWEYDIAENKMRWSDGMFDLFELKKDAYIYPELYLKYIVPEDKSRMLAIIKTIKQDFRPFEDEITLKIKGRKKILRIKAAVSFNEADPVKVSGMAMDITGRRTMANKLKEVEASRFQDILKAVINAQEEERRYIAEALHNEFGQLLSVAKMKIPAENADAASLLNQAIVQVRSLSYELMPYILQEFGLEYALKDMMGKKLYDAGIKYCIMISGLHIRINAVMEVAVYRIIQELLNNVVKHSEANFVELKVMKKKTLLYIQLSDNGIGFNQREKVDGFGLNYIIHRLHLHKGKMEISARQVKGSVTSIELPLEEMDKAVC